MSLIEVIMASMLLAIIASSVVGGIATVIAGDARNQQRLEALELANRLLLQYLDDKAALPPQERQIEQGRGTYRWVLRETPVQISMPDECVIDKPVDGPGGRTIEKLELLSVSVYAGVADGMGGFTYGERLCTLSRMYHPLSVIYRNPDKMVRLAADPAAMLEMMMALTDGGTTSRTTPGAGNTGGGGGGSRGGATTGGGGGGSGKPATGPSSGGGGRDPRPASGSEVFGGSRTGSNGSK